VSQVSKIYINGRFLSQTITGVQRCALELVRALDNLALPPDWQVVLLVPKKIKQFPSFRQIEIRSVGRLGGHLWEQLELPCFARDGFLVNLCNTGPLLLHKQLVTIHDAAVFRYPRAFSFFFRTWYRFLLPRLCFAARKIVTVSDFSRRELIELLGVSPAKVSVIVEGWEHLSRVPLDDRVLDRFGLRSRPFVLAVSSLNPYKNFHSVVAALDYLSDLDVDIAIAGGANPKVFDGGENALPSNVKYLGYVSDGELRALYSAATAFVFPSFYEGFGIPPLEAMSCGCPVVASNRASIPEVCGDAALYFDPESPLEIAEKIRLVLLDESVQKDLRGKGMGKAQFFSWEIGAIMIKENLEEILKL